ncbi:MAG: hypothetical protein ABI267_09510 [Ginsengibacter sp.]
MMKPLLTFFCVIILFPCYSQKIKSPQQIDINTALVAKNSRHTRIYRNGNLVKIFYKDSVDIKKIKGALFALRDGRIQVAPFGKSKIITMNLPDIVSVGLWARPDKTAAVIIGGTGLVALVGGALLLEPSGRGGVTGGNIIGFFFVIYAAAVLWLEALYVPYIFINESINKSSEKKGYHFSLEKSPQKTRHRFKLF